jgi:hypothetical protein
VTCIREVLVSILRQHTFYPDEGSLLPLKTTDRKMQQPLPYTSFPVHYSLITIPFDAIASEILRVSLNKIQNNRR